jgi:hypothetical protein
LRRFGRLFRDSLGWPAKQQSTSVTCGWLQSALGRHKCLPSYRTKKFTASSNFDDNPPIPQPVLKSTEIKPPDNRQETMDGGTWLRQPCHPR